MAEAGIPAAPKKSKIPRYQRTKVPILSRDYKATLQEVKANKISIEKKEAELVVLLKQKTDICDSIGALSLTRLSLTQPKSKTEEKNSTPYSKSEVRSVIRTPGGTKRKVRPVHIQFKSVLSTFLQENVKISKNDLKADDLLDRLQSCKATRSLSRNVLLKEVSSIWKKQLVYRGKKKDLYSTLPTLTTNDPTFTLSDGAQTPVSIMCRDRNILVATFSRLVLFNIGLDWGGLTREWFELLCAALFGHENKLFTRFKEDDPQALVHPNSKRPTTLKLKYYEFAGRIVGKCLFESAAGLTRRQNVKAKFTRSFLAQILGLKITYKYFESDDKDLYRSKIKYIEETNPEDLELMFSEEEYNSSGQVDKVVDLKPGGSQISVTQENKLEYLKLLAQYRLVTSTQQETDSFIKGLNEIVPDSLLCIFDEYELELLMCGTGHISVADMKQHHTITSGGGQRCHKVLNWFWTIVASLTQEELARLVQFITGSSQLPPGGFSELSPQLQISFVPMYEALPTAHTCFNQLCLPDYSSFEEMQRKLLIAITDGSEGFGMI